MKGLLGCRKFMKKKLRLIQKRRLCQEYSYLWKYFILLEYIMNYRGNTMNNQNSLNTQIKNSETKRKKIISEIKGSTYLPLLLPQEKKNILSILKQINKNFKSMQEQIEEYKKALETPITNTGKKLLTREKIKVEEAIKKRIKNQNDNYFKVLFD